jgi:hypothetical protein
MPKKHVYKVGDRIRIVNSRFIKRVGYPLHCNDLVQEFLEHPKLGEAMELLGISARSAWIDKDFAYGCAKAAVRARGWGGKERQIHYYDTIPKEESGLIIVGDANMLPDYTGQETEVLRKYTRMTGTYYPPSGGYSYDGDYDYEPGGLDNAKAHVILVTSFGDIEVCNVQPVENEAANKV